MGGPTVLVVEDDWLIAGEISLRAERIGCQVQGPAASVDEALDLIREEAPRAALLDVSLGHETSYRVADALMERHVPFAFVTAQNRAVLPARFQGCPVLDKPLLGRSLETGLEALLSAPGSTH